MAVRRTPLYIGTNRYIAALDPLTGEELWRTRLPHSGGTVVTIVIKGQNLFVGHAGHAYCLDKRSGQEQVAGGAIKPYTEWMLTLPYDTTIASTQRVEVGSSTFNVISVDGDKSWEASIRVILEKV